jgi:hypothetical protein
MSRKRPKITTERTDETEIQQSLVDELDTDTKRKKRELNEQLEYIGVKGGVDAPLIMDDESLTTGYKDPITLQGVLNVANLLPKNKGKPYSINKDTGEVDKKDGGKRRKTRRRSKKSKKRKSKRRRYRK